MDNVTILSTNTISGIDTVGVFLGFTSFFLGIVFLIISFYNRYYPPIIAIAMIIAGFLIIIASTGKPYDEYKILINDEASFNEIYNKYEILEKDGEIYTVREIDAK